jgi:hypothetical protein
LIPADSGLRLADGRGINEAGQICGVAYALGDPTDTVPHAFLATPAAGDVTVIRQWPNAALITVKSDNPVTLSVIARGPSLGAGSVADPVLQVRGGADQLIAINDDWMEDLNHSKISHPPTFARESALYLENLTKGNYTVLEEGNCVQSGLGEIEVYEEAPKKSTRRFPVLP